MFCTLLCDLHMCRSGLRGPLALTVMQSSHDDNDDGPCGKIRWRMVKYGLLKQMGAARGTAQHPALLLINLLPE